MRERQVWLYLHNETAVLSITEYVLPPNGRLCKVGGSTEKKKTQLIAWQLQYLVQSICLNQQLKSENIIFSDG